MGHIMRSMVCITYAGIEAILSLVEISLKCYFHCISKYVLRNIMRLEMCQITKK